jgi:hypothetical protein
MIRVMYTENEDKNKETVITCRIVLPKGDVPLPAQEVRATEGRISGSYYNEMNSAEAIAAWRKVLGHLYRLVLDWQTWLLKLSPLAEHFHTAVQCSLHVVDLVCVEGIVLTGTQDVVRYDALSYSWGRENPTDSIICDDTECVVSKSLEGSFRSLFTQNGIRCIWVDASRFANMSHP